MSHRPTTQHDRGALKAAGRRLVRACGGQTAAAGATRLGQQAISRQLSPEHEADHMPVDVLMDLTMDADDPVVIKLLCQMAHGVFVPLPRAGQRGRWAAELSAAVKEGGEAASKICAALADDGKLSAQEIRDLDVLRELREAIEALAVLQCHCDDVLRGDEA